VRRGMNVRDGDHTPIFSKDMEVPKNLNINGGNWFQRSGDAYERKF